MTDKCFCDNSAFDHPAAGPHTDEERIGILERALAALYAAIGTEAYLSIGDRALLEDLVLRTRMST